MQEGPLGRAAAGKRGQLPQQASGGAEIDQAKEEERYKQGVEGSDLKMFQILQHQVNDGVGFGVRRTRMAEPAPGFQACAHISKANDVVTRGNTREQRDHHQKNRKDSPVSAAREYRPAALAREHGDDGADSR